MYGGTQMDTEFKNIYIVLLHYTREHTHTYYAQPLPFDTTYQKDRTYNMWWDLLCRYLFLHKVDMDDVVFLTVYIQIPLHPPRCCCLLLTLLAWAPLLSTLNICLCCNIFLPTVDDPQLIHKYMCCIMTKCLTM